MAIKKSKSSERFMLKKKKKKHYFHKAQILASNEVFWPSKVHSVRWPGMHQSYVQ